MIKIAMKNALFYYFDSSNKYHCTSDNKCPDDYKLFIEKNECIRKCNVSKYIFEYNNTCYEICPNGTHIIDNNICEDDLKCEKFYNYNHTGCLEFIPDGYYLNNSVLKTIDKCNIKCKSCNLESMQNNLCLSCNINKNYYSKIDDNLNFNNFVNCYNEKPDGYILENNIYKPCYPTCKFCNEIGNKENNRCIQCNTNYIFIFDFENDNNCYEVCKYYYYFDLNKKYYCTIDKKCPNEFSKLIKEKNKCIDKCENDIKYKYEYNNLCYEFCPKGAQISQNKNYLCEKECPNDTPYENSENNECIKECKATDLFSGLCRINNDSPEIKDNMMTNIKEELMNGGLDSLLKNVTEGEKNDLVMKDNKVIYQFTTTENQNNNGDQNYNISIINLGECENKLKDYYNINKNEPLLIYKLDIYEEGALSPKVEYEVYNSITKKHLNLTICNDIKINIFLPALINKEEEYKYNPSSDYYNDICYTFTTENGTDIILDDRKNEYIINNMSLCESNCRYDGYNSDTQKAKCECEVKIKLPLISEIVIDKDELYNNFIDIKKNINIKIMKCYGILFSKDGLQYNIGNYILLSIILLTIVSCIIFTIKGFKFFNEEINKIISFRQKKGENYKKNENNNQEINNEKNKDEIKNINNCNEKNENNKQNGRIYNKNMNPPYKKKGNEKKISINIIKTNDDNSLENPLSKIEFNKKNDCIKIPKLKIIDLSINNNNNLGLDKDNNNINNKNIIKLNDYELNSLNYISALKIDKRGFIEYYLSLLRRKELVLFTFFANNDYNSKNIKLCLFIFSFGLYFTVNTMFFNDITMHKIYEDKGKFNFIYQIPQILYSSLISSIINIIITSLSLSEKNILSIKQETKDIDNKIVLVLKHLKIKIIIFFILNFLLLLLFWYYISCFCAIYKNTQIHLIKDTLISFGFYLLYPFGLNLFPGIFRIPALKSSNKNKECLYKLSKIIQLI